MRLIDGNALQIEMMDRGVDYIQTDDLAEINQIIDDTPTIDAVVIPGSVTNGDMIKLIFQNFLFIPCEKHNLLQMLLYEDNETQKGLIECIEFELDWWNAPYKAENR